MLWCTHCLAPIAGTLRGKAFCRQAAFFAKKKATGRKLFLFDAKRRLTRKLGMESGNSFQSIVKSAVFACDRQFFCC